MNAQRLPHVVFTSPSTFAALLIVRGKVAALKNSKRAIGIHKVPRCRICGTTRKIGKLRIVPSAAAEKWNVEAARQLRVQWSKSDTIPVDQPLWVRVITYTHDRSRRDLDNSLCGPLDALVKAGVIADDSQVKSIDGSRMRYDKEDPRVEITIRPYGGDDE